MQLLLVECDEAVAGWLPSRLTEAGFVLLRSRSIDDALDRRLPASVAAMLVETGMTGSDCGEIARQVRDEGFDCPLLFLATSDDWRERTGALDAGADDFMIKPMRIEEIVSRLRAAIRRRLGSATNRLRIGRFNLDLNARCAWLDSSCLDLTRNEFRLLRLLLLNPDRVIGPEEIRAELSPRREQVTLNAIEVLVARLRKKVGSDTIRTIRGMGYRYSQETVAADTDACINEPCTRAAKQTKAQGSGPVSSCECSGQQDPEAYRADAAKQKHEISGNTH